MRIHPTFSFFLSPFLPRIGLANWSTRRVLCSRDESFLSFDLLAPVSFSPFASVDMLAKLLSSDSIPVSHQHASVRAVNQTVPPPPEKKMHRIYGRVWGTVRKCDATGAYFSPGPKTFFTVQVGRASKSLFQGRFFSFFHVRSFILPFSLWLLLLFLPRLCAKSE